MKRLLISLGLLPVLSGIAFGQVAVQQSASHLDTGVQCQTIGTPAVNTANTLTFTVPAGQSLYLTRILLTGGGDSTGGAVNNGRITTTNLQSLEWDFTFPTGTSSFLQIASENNPNGFVKSSVGPISVTIVSPQSTHVAYGMSACGFFAP